MEGGRTWQDSSLLICSPALCRRCEPNAVSSDPHLPKSPGAQDFHEALVSKVNLWSVTGSAGSEDEQGTQVCRACEHWIT